MKTKLAALLFKKILSTRELRYVEKIFYLKILLLAIENYDSFGGFSTKISMKSLAEKINATATPTLSAKNSLEQKGFILSKRNYNKYLVPEANTFIPKIPEESFSEIFTITSIDIEANVKEFVKLVKASKIFIPMTLKCNEILPLSISFPHKVIFLSFFLESLNKENGLIVMNKTEMSKKFLVDINTLNAALSELQRLKFLQIEQLRRKLFLINLRKED